MAITAAAATPHAPRPEARRPGGPLTVLLISYVPSATPFVSAGRPVRHRNSAAVIRALHLHSFSRCSMGPCERAEKTKRTKAQMAPKQGVRWAGAGGVEWGRGGGCRASASRTASDRLGCAIRWPHMQFATILAAPANAGPSFSGMLLERKFAPLAAPAGHPDARFPGQAARHPRGGPFLRDESAHRSHPQEFCLHRAGGREVSSIGKYKAHG